MNYLLIHVWAALGRMVSPPIFYELPFDPSKGSSSWMNYLLIHVSAALGRMVSPPIFYPQPQNFPGPEV